MSALVNQQVNTGVDKKVNSGVNKQANTGAPEAGQQNQVNGDSLFQVTVSPAAFVYFNTMSSPAPTAS